MSESPPNASSSDEKMQEEVVVEEEVKVKGGENEEDIEKEEAKEEEEDEEEEEDAKEEDDDSRFTVKKHVVLNPQPHSSSSMGEKEESDLKSGSDSDLSPPPPENTKSSNNNTVVDPSVDIPITFIPIDGNTKQKKPKTTSTVTSTPTKRLPAKRTAASETEDKQEAEEVSKKRRKKKNVDHGVESEKKSSSNKLWSDDDEVVILKGMVSLMKKQGTAKPTSDMNLLLENIKASLHVDVTKDQLYSKVRKLKQKYLKAGTDQELQFSRTHDSKCYKLSKKIWGTIVKEDFKAINGDGVDTAAAKKEAGKSTRSRRKDSNTVDVSPQQQQLRNEVSTEQSRLLPSSFNELVMECMIKNSIVPPEGLKGFLTKEVLGFIGGSKAKDLEQKWNKLQFAEAKVYLDRMDLVREQVKLVLDARGENSSEEE